MPVFLGPVYYPGSANSACLGGNTIKPIAALNIFGGRMNVGTLVYRTGFNSSYNYNNWYLLMRGDYFWEPPKGFNESRLTYVVTTGSKKEIAEGLYRVSGHNMDNKDLELIMPLLPQKEQKIIGKKINIRINNPITNYKGMWKPLPKPLNKMTRNELVHHLRSFKDAWEKNTGRNQDLSDERLKRETTSSLRNLLKWYYSDSSKIMAEDYLR